jgi:hypothetical protein
MHKQNNKIPKTRYRKKEVKIDRSNGMPRLLRLQRRGPDYPQGNYSNLRVDLKLRYNVHSLVSIYKSKQIISLVIFAYGRSTGRRKVSQNRYQLDQ